MITFIHGPDRLLAREAALSLAASIDPDASNTTWMDARETGTDQVVGAVGAASFFGAPRVVIVTNLLNRTSRDSRAADTGAESSRSSGSDSKVESLLSAVPDQNSLIVFEPDLDSVPAVIKSTEPPITIIAGEPPRGSALVAWIEDAAKRAGAHIDRRTAQFVATTLFPQTWERKPANPRYDRPPDLALVQQEIEKLALAAHPDPITRDHVIALVPGGPDQRLFRFLDAAIVGDLDSAMTELDRLVVAGEEPAMILAQLLGQLELIGVASEANGRDANALARDLGSVTPARMSAIAHSAQRRRFPADSALEVGVTTDRRFKTGRIRRPEEALHQLMVVMAAPSTTHETGRS